MRVALTGQLVVAVVAALLARRLDLAAFEAYAVAAAIFVAMLAAAPLGADRLILIVLPSALADAPRVAALRRFSVRRAFAGTLAGAAVGASLGSALSTEVPDLLSALLPAVLALPWAVVAHLCLEALTAIGQPLGAMLALRLVVPAVALVLLVVALAAGAASAPLAIGAWGVGWLIAALYLLRRTAAALPPAAAGAVPANPDWGTVAWVLWLHRVFSIAMAQLALVALASLGAPPAEVGAYSVAVMIVGVALVFATATGRAYAREAALLSDQGDLLGIRALHRQRLRRIAPMPAILLLAALVFPGTLLSFFRPEFATVGAAPLRLLAFSAAISMVLALAPVVLKLRRRHAWLLGAGAAGVSVQLLLLLTLVPRHGATGAGAAYLAATLFQYAVLATVAALDLRGEPGTQYVQ